MTDEIRLRIDGSKQCEICDRTKDDGITLITESCGAILCEDCDDYHGRCPDCRQETALEHGDYLYHRNKDDGRIRR